MTDRAAVAAAPAHALGRTGRYRWVVVALLFVATIVNYVDRQMLGILKPLLSTEFGWSDTAYGDIAFWFSLAYAIGYIGFGCYRRVRRPDRICGCHWRLDAFPHGSWPMAWLAMQRNLPWRASALA